MTTFMVSFGSMYRSEPHPTLGWWPELGEGVLTIEADDETDARRKAHDAIGPAWCWLYSEDEPPSWSPPNLGSLLDAVAEPHPTSWTVGIQLTLNADGSLELHMEDAADDLANEGAPQSLVVPLDEQMIYASPKVTWVKRP